MAVFVVDRSSGEPRAVARPVRLGRSNAEKIEVLEGVSVGEEVVIDGLFALRDGAPVLVEKTSHISAPSES
jgi:multidrug efflux system membrane fusion protein